MPIDPKTIAQAKADYGDDAVRLVRSGRLEFLVRRPNRGEYQRFKKAAANRSTQDEALEDLILEVVVDPPRDEFAHLLETYPALCEELAETVLELAGLTGRAQAGKV